MNESLRLPDQFAGPWDHLLILSYGLDAVFFERQLMRQLAARCRDKIILTDGRQYIRTSTDYAESAQHMPPGKVRTLNRAYVAEGIFSAHAAHAKLALLANSERGRLLVGSGNLGRGYVSGAELYTAYDYTAQESATLPAFQATAAFIEELLKRRYISMLAKERVEALLLDLPWLNSAAPALQTTPLPIIHNLQRDMLTQLLDAVGGEPVIELWLHAPFFDRDVVALRRLLAALRPQTTHLLIQPGHTSVDAQRLLQVAEEVEGTCEMHRCHLASDRQELIHAKFYLLKLAQRSICLHGSPNLSQVALLLTDPQGNIELANLQSGPRDAFDDLLQGLIIGPAETAQFQAEPDDWDLRYRSDADDTTNKNWYLTLRSGEWRDQRLVLVASDTWPDFTGATLAIGEEDFALRLIGQPNPQTIELLLSAEAASALEHRAVRVRWDAGAEERTTNPIFACHLRALDEALQQSASADTLKRLGDLDLEETDIEALLNELNSAMLIDRVSVFQIAGRGLTPNGADDEEAAGPYIPYDAIDERLLQRHLQAYQNGFGGGAHDGRSHLQVILNAITGHFQGMTERDVELAVAQVGGATLVESNAQSEEDVEYAEEHEGQTVKGESPQREAMIRPQLRRLLLNFIRRFIKGLASRRFQEFAGVEIMTRNYEIFAHLLMRLFPKEWIEREEIVRALLATWRAYWGDAEHQGYFQILTDEEQPQALAELRYAHADAKLLVSLYCCITEVTGDDHRSGKLSIRVRDQLRHILITIPFPLTESLMEDVWLIGAEMFGTATPSCHNMVSALSSLAGYETQITLLRALERDMNLPSGSLRFGRVDIWLNDPDKGRIKDFVEALVATPPSITNDQDAQTLLRHWMGRQQLDHYHLMCDEISWGFYEPARSAGKYMSIDTPGERETLVALASTPPSWSANLHQLLALAQQVDAHG